MGISKKIVNQTLACTPVILSQFLVGIGWGWIAPTLQKLESPDSPFILSVAQLSWLASINEVGRFLGPFVSPPLVDNIGRKYTLVVISIMYFLVWSSTIFAEDIYTLCGARLAFGVANGVHDVVAGIYTVENCSTNFRGILGSIVALTHYLAEFIEFAIASYFSYQTTVIVNTAMAACVFTTLYFGIETPYFLIMKGKYEKAKKNLTWLSGDMRAVKVADELRQIEQSVSEEKLKAKSLKLLFSSSANMKGIFVVLALHIFQMATGCSCFVTFASSIFSPSGSFTADDFTILFGVGQFVPGLIVPFIIERIDRRSLMIGCFVAMAFSNICSCVLVHLQNHGYEIIGYPWLIFAVVNLYGMFCATTTPIMIALKGELLPLSVRAVGSSIAVGAHSLTSFLLTLAFLPIQQRFGMEMNFVIFSIVSLFATIFIYYILPETRGKSLHELQNSKRGKLVEMANTSDEKSEIILSQFLVGIGWGWIAPTIQKLKSPDSPFILSVAQLSWLASINEVGRFLGPFLSPPLVDNIGRKYTLVVISIMYFLIWSSTIFAEDIYTLCGARLAFGVANGVHDVVAGIYTVENCSTNFRGVLGSIVALTHYLAIFIEFAIASYFSYQTTVIVNTAMAACVFATLYFGIETPYFLIMKGKYEKAKKNLIWLSGDMRPVRVADELRQIEQSVSEEKLKAKSLKLLFSSSANKKGIFVVLFLHLFQNATGGSCFVTYTSSIFLPSGSFTADDFTIFFGIGQFIPGLIVPFIIERIDRRSLMIGCFVAMAFSNISSFVLVYLRNHGQKILGYPWLIFATVNLYGMFCATTTPIMIALKGELLPLSVRAVGSSIAVGAHSLSSFLLTLAFLPIQQRFGMEMNFVIFSIVSLFATIFIYYILPETRGKTLYELQNSNRGELVEIEKTLEDKSESKYVFT